MLRLKVSLSIVMIFLVAVSCTDNLQSNDSSLTDAKISQTALDVAQTSGQLASGTSFEIVGSSSDSTAAINCQPGPHGQKGNGKHNGILDGLNLLAPTDELLAI
ncbi:MAG: hypothetical protein ABIS36_01545, partial [Chryseolinea sp.]